MAQSSGTVTVNGSVGSAAAIRWWSFTPLNAESGVNTPGTQNGPLDFQLDVGDVAAGNNVNTYAGGTVQLMLRSNAAYTLTAQVTATSGLTGGPGQIADTDIGFGLANLANSGVLVFGDPATNSTIAGGFGNDPSAAGKNADDVPNFATTLNDISAATPVLSGPRISNKGGMGSPNNGLLVDTIYAIGPQLFEPTGSFSATVTYTISTP
jgi:hypothetical protein